MALMKKLTGQQRRELVDAAAGRIPVDTLIVDIKIVNLFTNEIYSGVIGIKHGFIAYARECSSEELSVAEECALADGAMLIRGNEAYAVPGFIDSHVHIESSMLTPRRFAEIAVPHGTTTIITDPHEIGNVLGIKGVEYMVESGRDLPQYQLALAPSCVPAAPGLEEAGAEFGREEIERLLEHERIIGIAEVMDYIGVVGNSEKMRSILDLGFEKGCFIQGHFFGSNREELDAYLCAGPSSNHEIFTPEAAKAAARAGMVIDARDSSFTKNIADIVSAVKEYGEIPNFTLCTDDREAEEIREQGHINDCLRSSVAAGLNPFQALRSVSLTPARLYSLDKLGAIAPGFIANINLVTDLASFAVEQVLFEGRLAAKQGSLSVPIVQKANPIESIDTVQICSLTEEMLKIKAPIAEGTVKMRVIYYPDFTAIESECIIREVKVTDGYVTLEGNEDLNFIAVINRHAGKSGMSLGLVGNFHLNYGALAGTVSHDSHNLTLVYTDPEEVLKAAREVKGNRGGITFAHGKELHSIALPVAGLMTNAEVDDCIEAVSALNRVLGKAGIETDNPIMRLAIAALPVIPHIRITDKGLVDVLSVSFLDLFVSS